MGVRVRNLPPSLRAWGATRHLPAFKGRTRVGWRLAERSLDPAAAYRTPHGFALRIDPADFFQVAMLLGFYEPGVAQLVKRRVRPGSVAIDVGHAIGYMSLLMASRTGPTGEVHAFDPDPRAHDRLIEHTAINAMPWISVNQLALGERAGTIDLGIHEQIGWSSTKPVKEFKGTTSVPMNSLDSYLQEGEIDPGRISLIKVDAEGAELEVLRGMRKALGDGGPPVVVEVLPHRPGERAAEVVEYMESLGYRANVPSGDVLFTKPGGRAGGSRRSSRPAGARTAGP